MKEAIKKQNYGVAMDILFKPYPQFQVITHSELQESEDEKIKKALIDGFKRYDDVALFNGWLVKDIIVWLEKQGKNNMGISEATKKKLEDNLNKALEKETPESLNKFLDEQGEQKPAWSEEDEKFFNTALWHISYSVSNGKSTDIRCNTTEWLKSLKDRVQPKQQGWSEDDERILACIENTLMVVMQDGKPTEDSLSKEEIIHWLKSLRPQSKQEWSEEDEEILNLIIERLHSHPNIDLEEYSKEYNWLNYRLKSLRPLPKNQWSKNDELNRQDTIRLLADAKERYLQTDASIPKCIKWLENLSPQSTWKPSDEHYELEEFAKIVRSNLTGISKAVQELFEAKYLQLTGNKMYKGFKD